MKIYRIKLKDYDGYVKAIEIGGEPFFNPLVTFEKTNAAWYDEDKAIKYVELLNEQAKEELWVLEFVKEVKGDK